MADISIIKDVIISIAKNARENDDNSVIYNNVITGTVDQVYANDGYCSVQPDDPTQAYLPYVALTQEANIPTTIPSQGSKVTVSMYNNAQGFVAQYGTVRQVNLAGGNISFGGLVKVESATDKINLIEDKLNTVIQWLIEHMVVFNTHSHVSVTSLGTPTPPVPLETKLTEPLLIKTKKEELENTAVTHGNGGTDRSEVDIKVLESEISSIETQLNTKEKAQIKASNDVVNSKSKGPAYDQKVRIYAELTADVLALQAQLNLLQSKLKNLLINTK
jgi:hypothetical protein